MRKRNFWLACAALFALMATAARAQVSYTNSFNTNFNYVTSGIFGTMWDGVYLDAGDFDNSSLGGDGPGMTISCDANITAAKTLTVTSTGTDWEGTGDDGFFLYKVVPGDFSAVVHIVTPFDNTGYNSAGLQLREFTNGGDPISAGENFISWTRFDEYSFANYLRNEVNGGVTQINPGDYPNSNYWVRIDRMKGTNFAFYERATSTAPWIQITTPAPVNGVNLVRADLANKALQVGIIHATFGGQLTAQFSDFSLTESNTITVTPPSPPTGLNLALDAQKHLQVSWAPGSGSAGSLVAVWIGTNEIRQMPANNFTYTGSSNYGAGSTLPGAGYFVVYAGTGTNVTVTNLTVGVSYNVAVYSYAGSASTTTYNHSPATGTITLPFNQIVAQATLQGANLNVSFTSNPSKWYWLQYSDTLNPPNWQNVVPGPVPGQNSLLTTMLYSQAPVVPQRFFRLQQIDPLFTPTFSSGFVSGLSFTDDPFPVGYLQGGARLGDTIIDYEPTNSSTWNTAETATGANIATSSFTMNSTSTAYTNHFTITHSLTGGSLVYESVLTFMQDAMYLTLNITNQTTRGLTIGDLILPMPMNQTYSGTNSSVMKHHFISGYGSYVFWMRPDSQPPYLLMTPQDNTPLEFWDDPAAPGGFRVYIKSSHAAATAAAQFPTVTTGGQRWRQPTTSLTLAPQASQTYGFKFQWVNSYDELRQALVDNGKVDVHIVPGMTLPTNLPAEIALRTTQTINSVTAEFPTQTAVQSLGTTNAGTNTYQLYQVQFSQLGENELTINYGSNRTMYLEFFITEPVETLIKKRAAYLVSNQVTNSAKWYYGLFCDVNMNDGQVLTPDNQDTLTNTFQEYDIASDDAGESRPAFMATKEALYPVQSEVSALDLYITNFVWGGLQRSTSESASYGIYGVPDWFTLRSQNNLGIGRGYDYPHIIVMYYEMYLLAKNHPEITTALPALTYLTRAYGTANAMWTYGGGQATQIGLMNEVVIPDLINSLTAEGMTSQAATLKGLWETKVAYYVGNNADLFASEYSFDATGFESQETYAKYAFQHAGSDVAMGSGNLARFKANLAIFVTNQITANIFDRGWLETAYYYYGSDYRSDMGDDFVVTYMAAMGGWGLLDYGLYYATNNADYLRLGYGSILSGWGTMNTGTPASNYGFWYHGSNYDGGCGGGFEPSPYDYTWLGGQPMHRGAWYYSAEENLGFCGAVRAAATILADDPIFGRFCYGGSYSNAVDGIEITPLDGVRRRCHAMFNSGNLHLVLDNDRFASNLPIVLQPDLSQASFQIESENTGVHSVTLHFTASAAGTYTFNSSSGTFTTQTVQSGQEIIINLPMVSGSSPQTFTILKTG